MAVWSTCHGLPIPQPFGPENPIPMIFHSVWLYCRASCDPSKIAKCSQQADVLRIREIDRGSNYHLMIF